MHVEKEIEKESKTKREVREKEKKMKRERPLHLLKKKFTIKELTRVSVRGV